MDEIRDKEETKNILDVLCTDITARALDGKNDPIVGRDNELSKIAIVLSRRKKNNVLLIGEPGVGKTAIPEALAQRIIEKKVPATLFGKTIYSLNISSIMAGTKYRGELEGRIKALVDELEKRVDVILFIDEIHTMMDAGSSSSNSLDIANMLKPALTRGSIQLIGATTLDESKKYFEKDAAMDRRFSKIIIDPLSIKDTVSALKILKHKYELHHGVTYPNEIIEEIPKLASRYIRDKYLPDSAIDIMDEVGAKLQIKKADSYIGALDDLEKIVVAMNNKKIAYIKQQRFLEIPELKIECDKAELNLQTEIQKIADDKFDVLKTDMLDVISSISRIPINQMSEDPKDKITSLEKAFYERLSGQDGAKEKVLKTLKRSFLGLSNPNKPIGTMLLLGKSGVGKTELAKIVSDVVFDGSLVRIDMNEYSEKFNVSKMVGAPAGYIGHEDGGQLTEQVRRNPFSVVLFDEVEKAHKDVLNIFLQILDEGYITDSLGRQIDFRNTIIMMTSNIGVKENSIKSVGFKTGDLSASKKTEFDMNMDKAVKNHFAPEIINRIDSIVTFDTLDENNMSDILEIELGIITERLKLKGIKLSFGKVLKAQLLKDGYSEEYGARFLKRHIESVVVDAISEFMLNDENIDIKSLSLTYVSDKVVVKQIGAKPRQK